MLILGNNGGSPNEEGCITSNYIRASRWLEFACPVEFARELVVGSRIIFAREKTVVKLMVHFGSMEFELVRVVDPNSFFPQSVRVIAIAGSQDEVGKFLSDGREQRRLDTAGQSKNASVLSSEIHLVRPVSSLVEELREFCRKVGHLRFRNVLETCGVEYPSETSSNIVQHDSISET